jgi:hypothetical protein
MGVVSKTPPEKLPKRYREYGAHRPQETPRSLPKRTNMASDRNVTQILKIHGRLHDNAWLLALLLVQNRFKLISWNWCRGLPSVTCLLSGPRQIAKQCPRMRKASLEHGGGKRKDSFPFGCQGLNSDWVSAPPALTLYASVY